MRTSYYANLKNIDTMRYEPIAISSDEGRLVGFVGRSERKLSPYTFFRKWKEKENMIEELHSQEAISDEKYANMKQENQQEYIKNFYNKVLRNFDAEKLYQYLGDDAVLLCFEKPTDFCHRFLVAGWLEMSLGVQIDEYGFENDKRVKENKENLKRQLAIVMNEEDENY